MTVEYIDVVTFYQLKGKVFHGVFIGIPLELLVLCKYRNLLACINSSVQSKNSRKLPCKSMTIELN